eukprot:7048638-Prymnesium_polylepis.1
MVHRVVVGVDAVGIRPRRAALAKRADYLARRQTHVHECHRLKRACDNRRHGRRPGVRRAFVVCEGPHVRRGRGRDCCAAAVHELEPGGDTPCCGILRSCAVLAAAVHLGGVRPPLGEHELAICPANVIDEAVRGSEARRCRPFRLARRRTAHMARRPEGLRGGAVRVAHSVDEAMSRRDGRRVGRVGAHLQARWRRLSG